MIAPASMLTPYSYLQMVWTTGLGYLVFRQAPDGWSAVGMAVIVGSGLMLAWLERRPRARAGVR
jgi:drug/metabolite transporter (DMT)-like permease